MTITAVTGTDRALGSDFRRKISWVMVPLIIYSASRTYVWFLVSQASARQIALSQQYQPFLVYRSMPADPGYLGIITNWDGQWYMSIATEGYQVPLAPSPDSESQLWAWAFPPLFPLIVRAVMMLSGASFALSASAVSMLAGAAAMVLLYRLLQESGGPFLALSGVLLSSFFVSSPLLQAAYSESLALLVLLSTFFFIRRRRYAWAIVAVLALSLTRIITLPLVAVVVVHAVGRLRSRDKEPFTRSDKGRLLILCVVSLLGVFAWLGAASLFVGPREGFARTEKQRNLYLGWFTDALHYWGPTALLFVLLIVAIFWLYAASRFSEAWGEELRSWSAAYPTYILAISPIMPGVLRYLLLAPCLPLMAIGSPRRPTLARVLVLVCLVCLLLLAQRWFVSELLVISTPTPRFAP